MIKKLVTACIIVVGAAFLCACANSAVSEASASVAPEASVSAPPEASAIPVSTPLPPDEVPEPLVTATPPVKATPGKNEKMEYIGASLKIVYYDVGADQEASDSYRLPENPGPGAALEAVNELLIRGLLDRPAIEVNMITYSEGNVFIDFTDTIYEAAGSDAWEAPVLAAVADSYLNNVAGIKAVYYSVEGAPYSSINTGFAADEPFREK